jgi:hypothetical protein
MRVFAGALIVLLLVAAMAPAAEACLECVALGLASFAVFNQLVWALSAPRVVHAPPAYYYAPPAYYYYSPYPYVPPVYYTPPPVSSSPSVYYAQAGAAPAYRATHAAAAPGPSEVFVQPVSVASVPRRVVQYPHGRYELRGDGVREPYVWVWIPTATGLAASTPVPRAVAATSE